MRRPQWRGRPAASDPLVCREFVELVTDYLEGALAPDEHARFEAHVADCDGCAGYLEDIRRIAASLQVISGRAPDPATREALTRAFNELRRPS